MPPLSCTLLANRPDNLDHDVMTPGSFERQYKSTVSPTWATGCDACISNSPGPCGALALGSA